MHSVSHFAMNNGGSWCCWWFGFCLFWI